MKRLLCLLPLVVACGDDGGSTPADAPTDGQITADAPTDAPSNNVTLTILAEGAGVPAVDVYFQNPDGSLAAKVATNASGVAAATVGAGGWVTVADPYEGVDSPPQPQGLSYNDVRTYAGVKPGDQLLMERGRPEPTRIDVTFTLPTNNVAAVYEVSTTCGGDFLEGTSGSISLTGCGTAADIVVVAYDSEDDVAGYFYKTNVAVADQGTVNLTAESYIAVPSATFSFTNMPAAFNGAEADNLLLTPRGSLYTTDVNLGFTAGAGSFTTPRPLATPTTSVLQIEPDYAVAGMSRHALLTWQPTAATQTVDGTDKFLPSFTGAPTYAAATRTVSWTSTGTVQPDFTFLEAEGIRKTPNLLAWKWAIIAPYTATNVTLPALPTDIAQFVPLASDYFAVLEVGAGKLPGGYDAIRPSFFSSNNEPPITGASGDVQVVMYNEPNVDRIAKSSTTWRGLFSGTQAVKAKASIKAKAAAKTKAASRTRFTR